MSAEACKATGLVVPVIDTHRCEGKEDCLEVCPHHVFDLYVVTDAEKQLLPMITRFKLLVHGGKQAVVARGADCAACGKCVTACPERAIKLMPVKAR